MIIVENDYLYNKSLIISLVYVYLSETRQKASKSVWMVDYERAVNETGIVSLRY